MSIVTDTGAADGYSDLPDLLYPSDSELAEPPAPTRTFTLTHTSTTEAPRIPPVPSCYGPFRVWCTLGQGAFGKAMGAQDIASNRLLCLKVVRKDHFKRSFTGEVLLNELEVYKRLASSMPCPAAQFLMGLEMSFQTKNEICFAMDLMASDLSTCISFEPEYCSENAYRWSAQIALGINALHKIGIIHRDIKPENILIDARENVRIADYGLCYVDEEEGPLDRRQAYTAGILGTPRCMAPEIFCDKSDPGGMMYGTPIDWWALGCIIFELFARYNMPPFFTTNEIRSYAQWCFSGGGTPKRYPCFKEFNEPIADLISGLLDPDPSSRYGFFEVANHASFLNESGESEFTNAYSRALEREELPDMLPDLQSDKDVSDTRVIYRLPAWEKLHVPNVDWVKPPFCSFL